VIRPICPFLQFFALVKLKSRFLICIRMKRKKHNEIKGFAMVDARKFKRRLALLLLR